MRLPLMLPAAVHTAWDELKNLIISFSICSFFLVVVFGSEMQNHPVVGVGGWGLLLLFIHAKQDSGSGISCVLGWPT